MVDRSLGWIALVMLAVPSTALAVTPESPEVRQVIDRGLSFLEKNSNEVRLGGRALIGLAMLKADRGNEHPKVQAAINACKQAANADPAKINADIYSLGLAVIFLTHADPQQYRPEIERYLKALELKQKPHGGWGYEHQQTGDTSMVQYAVLGSWEARQAGIPVSLDSIARVGNWLLRTQDPSGAWGYQGVDPGNFNLVPQPDVRLSLIAAGLGSTLICSDMLGMNTFAADRDAGLPPALKLVRDSSEQQPAAGVVDRQRMEQAIEMGSRCLTERFQINPPHATHYYLYALERAKSFEELAAGRIEKEPAWYVEGFKYLSQTQADSGSWQSYAGAEVDTAFAVLFLLRSTKKSIEKYHAFGDGTLVGGRGLPSSLLDVQLRRGRLIDTRLASGTDDLMQILADPEHPDYDYLIDNPTMLVLSSDADKRAQQIERLQRLVHGGSPEARRAAVSVLGRSDNLDVVPTLIFALSDGDRRVVQAAHRSLCMLSRSFDKITSPDPSNSQQLAEATKQWKAWYLTIRPAATFPDSPE